MKRRRRANFSTTLVRQVKKRWTFNFTRWGTRKWPSCSLAESCNSFEMLCPMNDAESGRQMHSKPNSNLTFYQSLTTSEILTFSGKSDLLQLLGGWHLSNPHVNSDPFSYFVKSDLFWNSVKSVHFKFSLRPPNFQIIQISNLHPT